MVAEGVAKRLEEITVQVKEMEEKYKKLEEESSKLRIDNWNSEQKIQKLEKEVAYWRDIATKTK